MPHMNRYTQGKLLPNTLTPLTNQPSFFFGDCQLPSLTTGELEDSLGEKTEIFEEPIGKNKNPFHLPQPWLKT